MPEEKAGMDWARDPSKLWNAVKHSERNPRAVVAQEITATILAGLKLEQQKILGRQYSQWIAKQYGSGVDFAILESHLPDETPVTQFQALITARRLEASQGIGEETDLTLSRDDPKDVVIRGYIERLIQMKRAWDGHSKEAVTADRVTTFAVAAFRRGQKMTGASRDAARSPAERATQAPARDEPGNERDR